MQTYGDPSLHSSILSGTLPIKFPAASNYDLCLHSWVPCLRSSSLYLNWERTFRQKYGVIIGFTSFVSLFAGIKVLCFLLSKIWKHLLHFGSFLQLFMSRRRAYYQCDLAIAKTLEIVIPSKYLLGYKVFLKPRNKWFSKSLNKLSGLNYVIQVFDKHTEHILYTCHCQIQRIKGEYYRSPTLKNLSV